MHYNPYSIIHNTYQLLLFYWGTTPFGVSCYASCGWRQVRINVKLVDPKNYLLLLCCEELTDVQHILSTVFVVFCPQLLACIDQLLDGNMVAYVISQKWCTSHERHVCQLCLATRLLLQSIFLSFGYQKFCYNCVILQQNHCLT